MTIAGSIWTLTTLVKLGTPLVGKSATLLSTAGWKKWNTWQRRTARRVAKECDFKLPKRQLRRALKDPETLPLLAPNDVRDAENVLKIFDRHLTNLIGAAGGQRQNRLIEIVGRVQQSLLRELGLPDSLVVLDARSAARDAETHRLLGPLAQHAADKAEFDEASSSIPPELSAYIRDLGVRGGALRVGIAVARSAEPSRQSEDLYLQPPDWIADDPSGEGWAALGIALAHYTTPELAVGAFDQAIASGINNRQRWRVRAGCVLIGHDNHEAARRLSSAGESKLCEAIANLAESRIDKSLDALQEWHPRDAGEQDLKCVLLAHLHTALGHTNRALLVLEQRLPRATGAGVHLRLASLLTYQAHRGLSTSRDATFQRAIGLALTARDKRRQWRLDSVEAIVVAADAALFAHDGETAAEVLSPSPHGTALEKEAQDPRLAGKSGLAAAMNGDLEAASGYAERANKFQASWIGAITGQLRGAATPQPGKDKTVELWLECWRIAEDDDELLIAARGLLLLQPQLALAGLDELRVRNPEAMTEIDELASAIVKRPDESTAARKTRLRAHAHQIPAAAIALSEMFDDEGLEAQAVRTLTDAADAFDDQYLRLQAAKLQLRNGNSKGAAETATDALSTSGPGWRHRAQAHRIALHGTLQHGLWRQAIKHGRILLDTHPHDEEIRWGLAHALSADDNGDEAWRVLTHHVTLAPDTTHRHSLLIELSRSRASPAQLIEYGLAALRQHSDDEKFAASVLAAMYIVPSSAVDSDTTDESTEFQSSAEAGAIQPKQLTELHQLTRAFLAAFPDSKHFHTVPTPGPDDVFESFLNTIGDLQSQNLELQTHTLTEVRKGNWPLGLLATVANRTYSEILIKRGAGSLFTRSISRSENDLDMHALDAVLQGQTSVIVDTSALNVIDLLDPTVRDIVVGTLFDLTITSSALRDMRSARESLSLRSTMTIYTDPETGRPMIHELSPDAADSLARRAHSLADFAQRHCVTEEPTLNNDKSQFEKFAGQPWSDTIALALDTKTTIWCDDLALTRWARAFGLSCFNTTAIVENLRTSETLSERQFEEALTALARNYAVDLPFDRNRLQLMAIADSWQAEGSAFVLSRPASWLHADDCISLLSEAVARNAGRPDNVEAWLYAAATGIIALGAPSHSSADIIPTLISDLAIDHRVEPDTLRAMITGCRNAIYEANLSDPWPTAAREVVHLLNATNTAESVARIMIHLCSRLDFADRMVAIEAAVRKPRDRRRPLVVE